MAEFNERLKELMEGKGLNSEQLSKQLDTKNVKISANTIRNYIKGITKPNCFEYYKILADFFNVSTDYIQGYAEEPSTDIGIKEICNKYGLKGKSLLALEILRNQKIGFGFKNINTVNYLLEDVLINKQNSIINVVTDYLFSTNLQELEIPVKYCKENGRTEYLTINGDIALKKLLIGEIEEKLNWLRDEIKKEGE